MASSDCSAVILAMEEHAILHFSGGEVVAQAKIRNRRLCSRCSPIMLSENILFMLKFSPIMLHP